MFNMFSGAPMGMPMRNNSIGFNPMQANPMQMIQQKFNDFASSYQGNPRQDVERMVQEGRISQQQLDQLLQQAQFMGMFMR